MADAIRLQIENVGLRYGKAPSTTVALENISMQVRDREFSVIVGPSGCGKSSLLYLAAGLKQPSSGRILLDGAPVEGPDAHRGMVFQGYTLFPWLSVRENIGFGPKRKGFSAARRKEIVDYYLEETGLTGFADHLPKQLSGGMRQRVAIARALANDPAILLMDEPFGALDSQTRIGMQDLLMRVWEHAKTTVLFVTHDIDEAILLGDRVTVMTARPGRVQQEIIVPIPRPRSPETVMSPEFIALKRQVLGLIHQVAA